MASDPGQGGFVAWRNWPDTGWESGRGVGTGRTEVVALAAAYLMAMLATSAGISGAVLLLFQVSVLGTPSPGVTPANLLHQVVAAPGAALPRPKA